MLVDEPAYGRRFGHVSWAQLLRTARRITDPEHTTYVLRPDWDTANASDDRGRARMLTLVSAFCSDLFRLGDRPVTSNDAALLALQRRVQQALASSAGELPGLPLLGPAEPEAREGRERRESELEREGGAFDGDGPHRRTDAYDDDAGAGEQGTRGRVRGSEKQRPLRRPPPPSAQKPREVRSGDYGKTPSISGGGRETQAHDDDDDAAADGHTPPSSSPASRRPSRDGQRRVGATSPTPGPPRTPSASTNKPRPQWKTGPRARRL
ncbi:hypothetical protein BDP81DRAFT_475050 [Colletotrichum phormii]|uniref:Uncharacterized protein n=1 Tax=Colletotrichum phormii TaxID=359342 RepID=A0AAJ0EB17_9PEZI|nr:uncharacterized protein BDP81DRAFT_475050 [Colletotrichum phormii]KAK1624570.1 hypothetical protein BDP81DRAFT_475050 [Colletotrichum phormii]